MRNYKKAPKRITQGGVVYGNMAALVNDAKWIDGSNVSDTCINRNITKGNIKPRTIIIGMRPYFCIEDIVSYFTKKERVTAVDMTSLNRNTRIDCSAITHEVVCGISDRIGMRQMPGEPDGGTVFARLQRIENMLLEIQSYLSQPHGAAAI